MLAKHHCSLKAQQGAVIVVALFFVALVATMAYFMMARLERDTYRTSLILRGSQAELYAKASVDSAIEQLQINAKQQKPGAMVDEMPMQSPVNEVDGYTISSKIIDMQSRINLNNLVTPDAQADFKRLIQLLNPAMNEQKVSQLILAISDWIRPGQQQNEFNQYYMNLSPPYRAAHRPMISVSELQWVKGMTPALFALLQPYVTVLPVSTRVNVQTASSVVIAALSPEMTLEAGMAILDHRAEKKFTTVAEFLSLDIVKNHNVPENKITTASQYFLVETSVVLEKQHVVLYTLLERSMYEGKPLVNIIWQSKGLPG